MIISLHIEYTARWGEQIYLCPGEKPESGCLLPANAIALNNDGQGHWFERIDPACFTTPQYHYVLASHKTIIRTEWGNGHLLPDNATTGSTNAGNEAIQIWDGWMDNPADKPFFSSAFTQSIFGHNAEAAAMQMMSPGGTPGTITFECEAATVRKHQMLAVCGNVPALGAWDPHKAPLMNPKEQPTWTLTLSREEISFPIWYKFVIVDADTHDIIDWEDSCDRYFDPGTIGASDAIVLRNLRANSPMPPWRGSGVAIPVFSLRSTESAGIGEFSDLRLMIDWAEKTHQSVIQILPVNDTTITKTWHDSYPYNSNSSFALNPIYIHLEGIGVLNDKKAYQAFKKKRQQLNRLPAIDWEKVLQLKTDYLKAIFEQQGEQDLKSKEYGEFHARNSHWLDPYALFCFLRDKYNTADFHNWKEQCYSPELLGKYGKAGSESARAMDLHKFVQYHLHRQLSAVRDYAHAHGVILKGDIPIGISRHSVDAWSNSRLYNLDSQAGAPPDVFDKNGQNWGFPTYNWQQMEQEGFRWFKERFVKMSDYFDAYRIDHILGFFRIWEIPMNAVQGLLGHFNPALPLSPEQMMADYGFEFSVKRCLEPYVTDGSMTEAGMTEEEMELTRKKFLAKAKPDAKQYGFLPRFSNQQAVEGYFANHAADEQPFKLKLFRLLTEVLFVEDPRQPGYYHPRINGMDTTSFADLTPDQQDCYRRLHDDFFYRRHDDFWRKEAMKKLPALTEATRMLVCGEDLGMIPDCVPSVMADLRILSLEVQRMPKGFEEFGQPQHYPYFSVCTSSSHDTSNIRAWWEEDHEATQRYYNSLLQCVGDAPAKADPWICLRIIESHLASPAMLCILPLQDWLGIDENLRFPNPEEERINLPSNPNNYWRYRMHLTLEELLKANEFNDLCASIVQKYWRACPRQ